jgi:hypothetical protein
LVSEHHYLENANLVGERLCYVVEYRRQWLALLGWSSAAYHVRARDTWIGWNDNQRRGRLHLVANHARFCLLEAAEQYPQLAGRALALKRECLAADWQAAYGHPIVWVESFVDTQLFRSTADKASGWRALDYTAGFWVDCDRDGDLDLYVANGAAGGDVLSKNSFYQNQGDGTFLKLTSGLVLPLISEWGYYDLPVWVDIDNDGWQDLFLVKTGNSRNDLYRSNGGRGFIKVTLDLLVMELDSHWGDAAWADYDNDGDLDVFLTTARGGQSTGPVAQFRNDGLGHFTKMTTNDVGTLVTEQVNTYACCWGDYDNDGWLDLHIANGWDGADLCPDLLCHNNGDGSFTKVTTGSPVTELGAG